MQYNPGMAAKAKSAGLIVSFTIAGAFFGWLISPLTDLGNAIGIVLFTPPTWAIAGFLLAVLIESRAVKKRSVNARDNSGSFRPDSS